jgi:hypothetical protein
MEKVSKWVWTLILLDTYYHLLLEYKSKRMRLSDYVSLTERIRIANKYRSKKFREGDMPLLVSNININLKYVGYVDVVLIPVAHVNISGGFLHMLMNISVP